MCACRLHQMSDEDISSVNADRCIVTGWCCGRVLETFGIISAFSGGETFSPRTGIDSEIGEQGGCGF